MVLSAKVDIRDSSVSGKGLVARDLIAAGEEIWAMEIDEEKYWVSRAQIDAWPEDTRREFMNFAYQIDDDTWSGVPPGVETDGSEFMNHSCNPNCAFVKEGSAMVATRDISPGEEITYDYCTSEGPGSTHCPFVCRCGTEECRGRVTEDDFLDPVLRERHAGAFLPHLARRQAAATAAAAE